MQTPLWQFWIDWTVKALGVLATFLVAFVALFGAWLRNLIAPPQLRLELVSREADPLPLVIFDKRTGAKQHETSAFWYHVRVYNNTRWNPVTDVHAFLLLIEQSDAAGDYKPLWVGQAALSWRHEPSPLPKRIGYSAEADLCHILQNPLQVQLSPIVPGAVPYVYAEACRIRVTLQARGLERDSELYPFEIVWDGQWSNDKVEMMRHLVVKPA
jgi:hypothetical protein